MITSSTSNILLLSPSLVWVIVYIPALLYFILTRLPSSSTNRILYGMEYGIPMTQSIQFYPYKVLTGVDRTNNTIDISSNAIDINVNRTILGSCYKLINLLYFTKSISYICNYERLLSNNTTTNNQLLLNDTEHTSPSSSNNMITNNFDLKYPLQQIYQSSSSSSLSLRNTMISDIIYRYDSTLGRGYILYTTHSTTNETNANSNYNNKENNRIYRFEIGYGIIPIGRTLFMENACCRSNYKVNCSSSTDRVCGPLVIEYTHSSTTDTSKTTSGVTTGISTIDTNIDGKLVIAEYGEQRIIRLEEENGARTPLVMHIPCIVDDSPIAPRTSSSPSSESSSTLCRQRLPNPHRMIYMPNGHLMLVINDIDVVVQDKDCEEMNNDQQCIVRNSDTSEQQQDKRKKELKKRSALVIVPSTIQVPPIPNLQLSREAHYWETMQHSYHHSQVQHESKSQNTSKHIPLPYIFYTDPSIVWFGNIVIASDGRTLYGCARKVIDPAANESKIVLLRLALRGNNNDDDEEEDDDDDVNTSSNAPRASNDLSIVMDLTNYTYITRTQTSRSRSSNDFAIQHTQQFCTVVIGQMGILYVSVYNDILLIDPNIGHVIGKIPISIPIPVSTITVDTEQYISAMTLGGDGYLYIGTNHYSSLYRIRTKDRPIIFAAK